jgi:hypothetical protein
MSELLSQISQVDCNDPQKSDQNKRDNLDKKKYKK